MTAPLFQRIDEAVSREGKPRGDHMIEAYAMMAKAAGATTTKKDQQMEGVFDCASRCIANEKAMFDGLAEVVPDLRALVEWALGDGTGSSSKALARETAGLPTTRHSSPSDTGDFGRCVRLIAAVPAARAAVDRLAQREARWGLLAAEWDSLTARYLAGSLTYEDYKAVAP